MVLDFAAIAAGVVKNNMGVGGIELRVRGEVEHGTAKFAETGQTLPARGAPAATTKPWQVFDVQGWEEGGQVTLHWQRERDGPDGP